MLPRTIKVALLLGVGTFLFASLALAGAKSIHVTQGVVLPGGQTLKAGDYAVVLNEKMHTVEFLQNSKVVATHPCKCTKQQKKNAETQLNLEAGPGNTQVLQQIRLQGETQVITLTS